MGTIKQRELQPGAARAPRSTTNQGARRPPPAPPRPNETQHHYKDFTSITRVYEQAVSLSRVGGTCGPLAQSQTITARAARPVGVTIMWLVSERRGRTDEGELASEARSAEQPRWSLSQRAGPSTVEFKSAACAGAVEPPAPPLGTLPDPQQFNIFPAFFSRQLNFTGGGGCGQGSKIMEELRPNLVGGLLGVPGLLDEHQTDAKFLQSGAESKYTPDKGRKCSNASSSSAEEFGGLYGGEHAATPPAPPLSRSLQDHSGKLSVPILTTTTD